MFFHRIHRISYNNEDAVHGLEFLMSCITTNFYSKAPPVTYFNAISCEFKRWN